MWSNYLKLALKVLLRRKFMTAISLLGIGFTLTVLLLAAAIVDHMIGPHPPETKGDRLLKVRHVVAIDEKYYNRGGGRASSNSVGPGLAIKARQMRTPEKIAVYGHNRTLATFQVGEKLLLDTKATDSEYWEIMEFDFIEGRPFTADEVARMSAVAVIDQKTGQVLFPGRSAVGQVLKTTEGRYRIVGVVQTIPDASRKSSAADIWVPLQPFHSGVAHKFIGNLNLLLLARDPSNFLEIRREFAALLEAIDLSSHWAFAISALPETELDAIAITEFGGHYNLARKDAQAVLDFLAQARLKLILKAVGAVLLFMTVTSLTLINLNVSRIMERSSEIGVRKSFGATSRQLVRQFLVENLVLTFVGGAVGLVVSYGILEFHLGLEAGIPADFSMNYRWFLVATLFTLLFGLISAIYPAWRMSRLHPAEAIHGGRK